MSNGFDAWATDGLPAGAGAGNLRLSHLACAECVGDKDHGWTSDRGDQRAMANGDCRRGFLTPWMTLEAIGDAVITTDNMACVTWLNPVARQLTGWSAEEAIGAPLASVYRVLDKAMRAPRANPVSTCLAIGRMVDVSGPVVLVARDGAEYGVEDCAAPMRDEHGNVLGAVLMFHDASRRSLVHREMRHRATHDPLTGLINRDECERRIAAMLAGHKEADSGAVLMLIDLDHFKVVNEACGHAAGERLLKQVSLLLRSNLHRGFTLARLGEDVFGLILEHCLLDRGRRAAMEICELIDQFRFFHEQCRLRISASIGLIPLDERWRDGGVALQAAETCCHAAKEAGRNRVHVWLESDRAIRMRRDEIHWMSRLEEALEQDRFELFGQIVVPVAPNPSTLHCEVLIRMREPDGRMVLPVTFLSAAERFHRARHLDRWVVTKVMTAMEDATSVAQTVRTIAINLSAQSIGDPSFHSFVIQMVRNARFDVRQLCFEITETAAITNLTQARAFIEEARGMGVQIALDDFGAGNCSFSYLKNFSVDFLKIDGQFVRDLPADALGMAAIRCFRDVAGTMGVKTIAEFVESEEVFGILKDLGIDMCQGYLFHQPEPLAGLLRTGGTRVAHRPVPAPGGAPGNAPGTHRNSPWQAQAG